MHLFVKGTDTRLSIKGDAQRRSMKGIILLFIELYTAGTRDSGKYIFPDLTKVSVTINGSPNMLYSDSIESKDMWEEANCFFVKEKNKREHMNLQKFCTEDKLGLLIDLHSIEDNKMHGSGTCLVNSKDGVHLEIE